jgi:hypothetical protein
VQKEDFILSYQYRSALFEHGFTGIIYALSYKNIGITGLRAAIVGAIPSLSNFFGTEQQLAPAVINSEITKLTDTCHYRAKYIILTITVWGKCGWYKYFGSRIKHPHYYIII